MSIKKEYTETELHSLIADVTKEFTRDLAKAEKAFNLAKNDNFQPKDKKENGEADDEKNSAKDEKQSAMENKDGGKSDDKHNAAADEKQENGDAKKEASKDDSGKPMEGEKEEDKGIKDQHQQSDDEAHGYDDEDLGHMHSMYSSMSKGELKAHHDSIRKCMDGMGLAKCEAGMSKSELEDAAKDAQGYRPNGGPKDGKAENQSKSAGPTDDQAMNKSEKSTEVALLKSELEAAKASGEEHKKNLEAVEAFLKKFVEKTAPAGKAITSLDIIAKSDSAEGKKSLSKSEIDAKLLAKASDPSLKKSDRDAITSFYFNKNIESVRHLLS
jgi:hypothetical protein